jgi:hypothetical protein
VGTPGLLSQRKDFVAASTAKYVATEATMVPAHKEPKDLAAHLTVINEVILYP